MTIPNLITSLRIILVPVFVIHLIQQRLTAALIIFVIAGISDGVDGLIARVLKQKSKLGAYLDPLADKILLVAAFVFLAVRELIPPWLTVLVISRDVMILLGVLILFLIGTSFTVKPFVLSKATTCFQLATVIMVLSQEHLSLSPSFQSVVFWTTAVLTVTSGLHYMMYWFRMIGEGGLEE